MKTSALKLTTLFMIPFLTACTGGTMVLEDHLSSFMSVSNMSGTEIYYSVKKSNGYIIYLINVKEEHALNIHGEVKLEEGSLEFVFYKYESDDQSFNYAKATGDLDFDIPLTETGKYKIKITHEDFKGSYRLNWAKK